MLTGTVILETIMEILKLESVSVSTRGLRHGMIMNYIDPVI
jgi:exopolyphosphatase/pppGpp-phosphohydrolase